MKLRRLILIFIALISVSCGALRTTASFYEQQPQILRAENDGTYLIRSTGVGRTAANAMIEAHKNAIYEILFKGISSSTTTNNAIRPLVREVNAREKYSEYFNAFFADGGLYLKFIDTKEKRTGSSTYAKNKSQVQCTTDISVDISKLKIQLINDNIIKQ